jgi:hypothetical protein
MHELDLILAQKMLGLQQLPQSVIDEYEKRANLICRGGAQLPLTPHAMCDLLRYCNLEGPTALRPAQLTVTEWRRVAKDSRIIYQDERTNEPPRPGKFLLYKTNGCLDVMLDGEVVVKEFAQRHVKLDDHWSDDPWAGVTSGRAVSVLRGKREFDAAFVRVEDAHNLRVRFKGGEQVVSKADVKLLEAAAAA